ncbi:hypothetical protein M407DRAFT_23200 [Tulasnella calospora MUT 4182]|uniref:Uncharacterized protein n=1 Tax=Tulasnella calospora MUT 4182 TaxID=1051891 RepID=A0A0C3QJX4_9AGAM|nr:hypothetical protein M407DRAFT_23200 [Tulasnella calospora MUT 4182]
MLPKSTCSLVALVLALCLAFAPPSVDAASKKTQKACPGNSIVLPTRQKKKTVCVCQGPNGGIKPFNPGCSAQLFSFFTIQFCFAACTPQPTTSPKPKKKNSKKDLESDAALALVGDGPDEDAGRNDIEKLIDWSNASPCPYPSLACPMFSSPENRAAEIAYDFECVDPSADLGNCGGCSSLDDNFKCPAPISARSLGGNAGRGLTSHGVKRTVCQRGYKIDSYYYEGFNNATVPSATTTTGGSLVGRALQGKWKQRCVPASH